jgi:uncharacterized repeat protein (TIGR03803 family)
MKPLKCPIYLVSLLVAIFAMGSVASAAWKEKVLYSFQGGTDGSTPAGGVVFDAAGNLYGATEQGGGSDCKPTGYCGTVFQLKPPAQKGGAWTETVLHVFVGVTSTEHDGADPGGGLVIDAAGNLYGTTAYGGSGNCVLVGIEGGCGTVFELEPPKTKGGAWAYKILYNLQGGKDGHFPWGDLVFDGAGNLYGATQFGGGYGSCDSPFYQFCGAVFELSPPKTKGGKWTEKVLYGFKSGKDGANPNGGLVFDSKGAIYGTTYSGGDQVCKGAGYVGCGTAYKLSPPLTKSAQWTEKLLRSFAVGFPNDGAGPNGGLVVDAKGRLYGTTVGGASNGNGVVFRLAKSGGRWTETIVHTLQNLDGWNSRAGLVFDTLGNLYGTATGGGLPGGGTVFKLSPPGSSGGKWRFSLLHAFTGTPDGSYPAARLTFDKSGNVYSTTQESGYTGQPCGSSGCGTVFMIAP